jgi:hypothetical protein
MGSLSLEMVNSPENPTFSGMAFSLMYLSTTTRQVDLTFLSFIFYHWWFSMSILIFFRYTISVDLLSRLVETTLAPSTSAQDVTPSRQPIKIRLQGHHPSGLV